MQSMRIAVVGAGNMAQRFHLPSLKRLADEEPGLERVAICDLEIGRAQKACQEFGFGRAYSDYRAMLEAEAPDAVWVLVAIPALREVAGFFVQEGVPVLMEKPAGRNAAETRELVGLAARTHTPTQVAFNRRYAPLMRRMKALLDQGGHVDALSCHFWRYNVGDPTFAFGSGIHAVDALRYLAQGDVCQVHARVGARYSALATLVFDDGMLATLECLPKVGFRSERYAGHAGDRTVLVDGFTVWHTLYPGYLRCYDRGVETEAIDNALDASGAPAEIIGGFYDESAAFVRALRQGIAPRPSVEEALKSVAIAEAISEGRSLTF